jgi:hypothetical protein
MIILSHRGYWKTDEEKNKEIAFRRSYNQGFGIETDIRDLSGELVISHNPPKGGELTLIRFLEIYKEYDHSVPLALNIKADGLQSMLKVLLTKFSITNYFVFDMSVPDTLQYLKYSFKIFSRQSEVEKEALFYKDSKGVWIDCFNYDWVRETTLKEHLANGKRICLVSPELHHRKHMPFWETLKSMQIIESHNILICTDYPEQARSFFHGKRH